MAGARPSRLGARPRLSPDPYSRLLVLLLASLSLLGCGEGAERIPDAWSSSGESVPHLMLEWSLALPAANEGSPSLCDLDADGRLEVIAPLSSSFAHEEETGVLVADALNGEPRFALGGVGSHPYGSAACARRGDGAGNQILIGGRAGDIFAISGVDGSVRYRLSELHREDLPSANYPYAFASPVALSADGSLAATVWVDESEPMPLGRLILFRPEDGVLLAVFEAPDGEPAYASPSFHQAAEGETLIVFPAGGEISPGRLYILAWDGDALSLRASFPSSCEHAGFVASAHLADLDGDGEPEIVAGDYCGGIHAATLKGEVLFLRELRGTVNANPVTGDFDGDGKLDILAIGTDFNPSHPQDGFSFRSEVAAFRGSDGEEIFRFTHEMPILASPAILDLNGDAFDDFILVSSDFREPETHLRRSGIHLYDGKSAALLSEYLDYRSLSTPVIDDVDGDGVPDLFVMQEIAMEPYGARLSRFTIRGVPPFDAARSFSGFRGHPGMSGGR